MSAPLRILIATDSFPPVCGGSGWSTWELSRGLIKRGHHVEVVKVDASGRRGVFETTYDGIRVSEFCREEGWCSVDTGMKRVSKRAACVNRRANPHDQPRRNHMM